MPPSFSPDPLSLLAVFLNFSTKTKTISTSSLAAPSHRSSLHIHRKSTSGWKDAIYWNGPWLTYLCIHSLFDKSASGRDPTKLSILSVSRRHCSSSCSRSRASGAACTVDYASWGSCTKQNVYHSTCPQYALGHERTRTISGHHQYCISIKLRRIYPRNEPSVVPRARAKILRTMKLGARLSKLPLQRTISRKCLIDCLIFA